MFSSVQFTWKKREIAFSVKSKQWLYLYKDVYRRSLLLSTAGCLYCAHILPTQQDTAKLRLISALRYIRRGSFDSGYPPNVWWWCHKSFFNFEIISESGNQLNKLYFLQFCWFFFFFKLCDYASLSYPDVFFFNASALKYMPFLYAPFVILLESCNLWSLLPLQAAAEVQCGWLISSSSSGWCAIILGSQGVERHRFRWSQATRQFYGASSSMCRSEKRR